MSYLTSLCVSVSNWVEPQWLLRVFMPSLTHYRPASATSHTWGSKMFLEVPPRVENLTVLYLDVQITQATFGTSLIHRNPLQPLTHPQGLRLCRECSQLSPSMALPQHLLLSVVYAYATTTEMYGFRSTVMMGGSIHWIPRNATPPTSWIVLIPNSAPFWTCWRGECKTTPLRKFRSSASKRIRGTVSL